MTRPADAVPRVALALLCGLLSAGGARAQGPDLVQVTFTRAFGKRPIGPYASAPPTTQARAAVTAGRSAAELPADATRRDAFVRQLGDALAAQNDDGDVTLLVAIVKESLGALDEDRAYLHARLAEVNATAEALVEQASEYQEAQLRLASPLMTRAGGTVQVTILNVDGRIFANDDSDIRRTHSCDPCFTRRNARLRLADLEREMANATVIQTRVLARRDELLGRGAEFNRRAQEVVQTFALALRELDQRQGGSISTALRNAQ
jgi:hypothetical protein